MAFAASKYQSLEQTVSEWSVQSGELQPVTLRRICDWAICGGFPEGTFLFPTGQTIDLLELHRAMRIAVGVASPMNQDLALDILQRAVVSKAGIEEFCERLGVDAPGSIGTMRSRIWRLVGKPRHVGPPDCPSSAKLVAKLEARFSAVGLLGLLARMLPRAGNRSEPDMAKQVDERWLEYFKWAQSEADASEDVEIQRELAVLNGEWNSLKFAAAQGMEAAPSDERVDTQLATRRKRGVGRPQGSGSLENEDIELVEEMRRGIVSGQYLSIAAAARAIVFKAGGAGTTASKEKRLTTRYSERYAD